MAGVEKGNPKREHVDCSTSPAKKPKVEPNPIKINDINVDCLERIFKHLSVTDLNNLAEAHSHFLAAARLVYKRDHSKKTLAICQSTHMVSVYSVMADEIVAATATSLLHNFGDLVHKLRLDYTQQSPEEDSRHHWRAVERVIFERCTKTLLNIQLINCHGNVLEEIRQPFEKVSRVYIFDGVALPTTLEPSKWFPKPQQFIVDCGATEISRFLNGEFRALDELRLSIRNYDNHLSQDETKIRTFLRTNHQIKKLSIDSAYGAFFKCDFDFLLFISQTLTQLQELRWIHMKMKSTIVPKQIRFKHVKSLELGAIGKLPETLSISFDQLTSLKLHGMGRIDRKWLDFTVQNKNLVELVYFPHMGIDEHTANSLLKFISESETLIKVHLRFFCGNKLVRRAFVNTIGPDWRVTQQISVYLRSYDLILER